MMDDEMLDETTDTDEEDEDEELAKRETLRKLL